MIRTTKGEVQYLQDDFLYQKEKKTVNETSGIETTYCRCIERFCRGRLVIKRNLTTGHEIRRNSSGQHSHPELSIVEITNLRARQQTLENYESGNMNAYDDMQESLTDAAYVDPEYIANHGPAAFITRPQIASAKSRINKAMYPPLPESVRDIDIPMDSILAQSRPRTADGHGVRFLLACEPVSASKPEKVIIIYATDFSLQKFAAAEKIQFDGTFKPAPNLFHSHNPRGSQIFTFFIPIGDHTIFSVIYCFLPGKTKEIYMLVLRIIRQACEDRGYPIRWNMGMGDYETGFRSAFRQLFPHVELRGCFFHFCQAVFKFVAARRPLRNLYTRPDQQQFQFKLLIRDLMALALLPVDEVVAGHRELLERYQMLFPAIFAMPEVQEVSNSYDQNL